MKALAVVLVLACSVSAAQPPGDAPRMEKVDGGFVAPTQGYFLNDAGYARLEAETTRLQVAEMTLQKRVDELQSTPVLTAPAILVLISAGFAAGFVVAWRLHP